MSALMSYLTKNQSAIVSALGQHIELSVIAILITVVIAIPLAAVSLNHRKLGELMLQVTGVIQTIPSLAILGILIPFVGIGTVPAIIALVLYAIMPVFQNTYAGLTNIDPLLIEAADAFGVSKRFKLFKVQFPLAMPMIISGIRIAVVMVIGTATLAALIGGGGLGTYIILGIQTNNNNALIVGAVLSAVLALVASALIRILVRVPVKHMIIGIMVLAMIIAGGVGVKKLMTPKVENVVIAGKMGGEPEILINMYKDLIEQDNPNVKVTLKPNFGGTSFLFKALQSHKIDIYPEFTGTVLQSLVQGHTKLNADPNVTYQTAKQALVKQYQMAYLKPMRYQNGYGITVTQATARKYHLRTYADLKRYPQLWAAFDPDFYQQSDGYPGLQKTYGLNFKSVRTMEPALRYEALAKGKVDVTDAYTTDPQIKKYHLVLLTDNKHFFPPYQGAPLMTKRFMTQHPQIVRSLKKLAGRISTTDMQTMNYQVTVQHQKAATVAKHYLKAHHLLK